MPISVRIVPAAAVDPGLEPADASGYRLLLEAAGNALTEAQENLEHHGLAHARTLSYGQVVELSGSLASEAWEARVLAGEAPIEPLHEEVTGWAGSKVDSVQIPWLLLAMDVLDCISLLMGPRDQLIVKVE